MTTLTDQKREDLKVELDAIDAAQKPIMALMEPLREAIAGMEEVRAITLLRYGLTDPPECCEFCTRMIVPGDMIHRGSEDEFFCYECAPTHGNMKAQLEDRAKDPNDDDHDGVGLALRNIEFHIATGGSLDDKCVHEYEA